MANERPTDFPALTGANLALTDLLTLVDVSDTADNAAGSDKKILVSELRLAMRRLLSLPEPAVGTNTPTNSSSTTWVDVAGVAWAVTSGRKYYVKIAGVFQTAATTTGMQLQFSGPTVAATGTPTIYRARLAAAGTDSMFESGQIGTLVTTAGSGVLAATTDQPFFFEGVIEPTSTATLQLQFRSEVNTSQVQIRSGCSGFLIDLTGT